MMGNTTSESILIELARLAEKHGEIPLRYIEDVSAPVDDGRYVSLVLVADGRPAEVLVLTTENFYDCLRKLMVAALPSMGQLPAS
jgi:hypothetical protein